MAEVVLEFVLGFVWWIALFPLVCVLAAPAIFVMSIFDEERYWCAVATRYRKLTSFWTQWGQLFAP